MLMRHVEAEATSGLVAGGQLPQKRGLLPSPPPNPRFAPPTNREAVAEGIDHPGTKKPALAAGPSVESVIVQLC